MWVSKTVLSGSSVDANGTASHTCTFTAATAGNFLIAVVSGSVTFTTPSGWTLATSAVNNCGLYLYTKTASSGESSFSTTHNASNYPIQGIVYEYAAGTSVIGTNSINAITGSGSVTGPQVTGLSGTYTRFAVRTKNISSTTHTASCVWATPGIEDSDVLVPKVVEEGVYMTVAYDEGQTGSSFNPSADITSNSGTTAEAIAFALLVVDPPIPTIPIQWILGVNS